MNTATPTILLNPDRIIFGADYLEDAAHPATRSLPGIVPAKSSQVYIPTDIRRNLRWRLDAETHRWVAGPAFLTEEDGWQQVPSARVMKRRARAAERRKERQGWLGSLGSLVEPSTDHLPAL